MRPSQQQDMRSLAGTCLQNNQVNSQCKGPSNGACARLCLNAWKERPAEYEQETTR